MNPDEYRTVCTGMPKFWADKYARESSKIWDKFYKRNKTNFYRDRHWTTSEQTDGFPCLAQVAASGNVVLVEAGCGVANCAFPLLEVNPSLFIYAFDFAPSAVALVRQAQEYKQERCHAFVWDFCKGPITSIASEERAALQPGVADFCTLIFVLSAVSPDKQVQGVKHLHALLKPKGRLLFRDYATGDMAQQRFAANRKIEDNYFVRQDSTLSYFFDEDRLNYVMTSAGFELVSVRRIRRVIKNRKEKIEMHRVFLQAEYQKGDVS